MSTGGRTVLIIVILLSAVLLAAGNILCHALVVQELTGTSPPSDPDLLSRVIHSIGASIGQRPQFVWFFSGAPLVVGAVVALLVGLLARGPRHPAAAAAAAREPGESATDGALRLL